MSYLVTLRIPDAATLPDLIKMGTLVSFSEEKKRNLQGAEVVALPPRKAGRKLRKRPGIKKDHGLSIAEVFTAAFDDRPSMTGAELRTIARDHDYTRSYLDTWLWKELREGHIRKDGVGAEAVFTRPS